MLKGSNFILIQAAVTPVELRCVAILSSAEYALNKSNRNNANYFK